MSINLKKKILAMDHKGELAHLKLEANGIDEL
jgi:hypothetical protein